MMDSRILRGRLLAFHLADPTFVAAKLKATCEASGQTKETNDKHYAFYLQLFRSS
jgi:hypothetical protein